MIYTQVNFYRHGAQSTMGARGFSCAVSGFGQVLKSDPGGIQEDLVLTVPGISNPCDLPGMRHRYGGDLLNEPQGRKE